MVKPHDDQDRVKIKYDEKKLKSVCEAFDLLLVILHGSRVSQMLHKESDIDIAILGKSRAIFDSRLEIIGRLSEIFGDSVDIVILNQAESMITYQVALKGVPLYERSRSLFAEFKTTAISRYQDASKFRALERKYLGAAIKRMGND